MKIVVEVVSLLTFVGGAVAFVLVMMVTAIIWEHEGRPLGARLRSWWLGLGLRAHVSRVLYPRRPRRLSPQQRRYYAALTRALLDTED